jgi:Restriction endonuclease
MDENEGTRSESSNVDRDWKSFERLVALIEETLGPAGVVLKSPDHIRDLLTGSAREVDASIRYKIGSAPVLITVECRRRNSTEDSTWIEQLACKKGDIGADKTIAVSSSGFSGPAIAKARLKGIETRTLTDITANDVLSWCGLDCIHFVPPSITILEMHFLDEAGTAVREDEIAEATLEAIRRDNVNAHVLQSSKGPITVNNILNSYQREFAGTEYDINHGVQLGGETQRKTILCRVDPTQNWVQTLHGVRSILHIVFMVDVKLELRTIPMNRIYRYRSPESGIVDGVEFVIPEFSGKGTESMRVLLQNGPEFGFKATLQRSEEPRTLMKREGEGPHDE